ncbi:MAG: hypothetical protein K2G93_00435 [Rikenella sp.]|nr:hypothetical protein [Rikenella sp.]
MINGRPVQFAFFTFAAIYPAPGVRGSGEGALSRVGRDGYNWSSSASGSNGYYLDFNYSRIYPNYSSYRVNGLPLRCLQE